MSPEHVSEDVTHAVREAGRNRQSAEPLLEGREVFTEVVRTSATLHILTLYLMHR